MRYARIGDEMPKTTQKLTYEEFAEHLPDVLDELAVTHDPILVEKDGRTFRVALAEPALDPRLPPLLPLEERLELLRQSRWWVSYAGSRKVPGRASDYERAG
jgi:hypothetical protein